VDSGLIYSTLYDARLIKNFYMLPGIWETFAEDGLEEYEPDFEKNIYLAHFYENRIIGIYILEVNGIALVRLHIALLKEYRSRFLKKTALNTLRFIIDSSPNYVKAVAGVPKPYKHLYRFCKQLGFKDEGINRESFFKGGQLVDVLMLGLTRDEIREVLS
jgi:RimJ/RimL family protein N-acetyltransferase